MIRETQTMAHSIWSSWHRILMLCATMLSAQARAEPPQPEAGLLPSPAPSVEASPPPPPSDVPGDCGLNDDPVPDFELIDLNPGSATYKQAYTLDTFQSQVLVIYWALAS
jgi:hypothetical protein